MKMFLLNILGWIFEVFYKMYIGIYKSYIHVFHGKTFRKVSDYIAGNPDCGYVISPEYEIIGDEDTDIDNCTIMDFYKLFRNEIDAFTTNEKQ